jgi:hypothetical protein
LRGFCEVLACNIKETEPRPSVRFRAFRAARPHPVPRAPALSPRHGSAPPRNRSAPPGRGAEKAGNLRGCGRTTRTLADGSNPYYLRTPLLLLLLLLLLRWWSPYDQFQPAARASPPPAPHARTEPPFERVGCGRTERCGRTTPSGSVHAGHERVNAVTRYALLNARRPFSRGSVACVSQD